MAQISHSWNYLVCLWVNLFDSAFCAVGGYAFLCPWSLIKIEIIYNHSQTCKTFWTTCGSGSCITNSIFLQSKIINSNNLYLFNNFTINYINRLINGQAGNIYYNDLGYREDTIDLLTLQDA